MRALRERLGGATPVDENTQLIGLDDSVGGALSVTIGDDVCLPHAHVCAPCEHALAACLWLNVCVFMYVHVCACANVRVSAMGRQTYGYVAGI